MAPHAPAAAARLVLGTAQMGLDYGVANARGRMAGTEACRLLDRAQALGVRMLDTAPAYGESERVVGGCLGGARDRFQVVTKTAPLEAGPDARSIAAAFDASLRALGVPGVHALLVHHAADLLGPAAGALRAFLEAEKARGRTGKIGVSVYTRAEIDAVLSGWRPDIVQLPVNALDQRLVLDGTLAALKRAGIEIHARSVFLQGLLLMAPDAVPKGLAAARAPLRRWRAALAEQSVTPLAGALASVARLQEVDRIVVGVDSAAQLEECVAALEQPAQVEFPACPCDEEVLDPRRWPPKDR